MTTHVMNAYQNELLGLKKYTHLVTGIVGLDEQRGITTEDFMTIFGGSGSGKSLIALYMACSMAKKGHTVVFLNAENSPKIISDRIKELGFNYERDFGKLDTKGETRLKLLSMKEIKFESLVQYLILYKPQALFIDLFSSLLENVDSYQLAKMTTHYAKELSFYPEKYNCAVIVTEQLTKDNKRTGRPSLNDVAGGAGLIRKSTKALAIYRYSKERLETLMTKALSGDVKHGEILLSCTELIVRKDRLGHWRDGLNFVKYAHTEGFLPLESWEQQEYLQHVFGSAIGGKK